jgi:hypothetical protein
MLGTISGPWPARSLNRSLLMVAAAATAWASTLAGSASAAIDVPATQGATYAQVSAVSCPSAGNCAAVGYLDPPGQNEVFVVNQTHGTWGKAEKISLSALPKGGAKFGVMNAVSCSSAGNCSAGGTYYDHADTWHAFVVTQTNGTWGKAEETSGITNLHVHGKINWSEIDFLSCRSAGTCSAVGDYASNSQQELFVVSEKNGTWGPATELPGIAALSVGAGADVNGLSCSSAGDCAAGGDYTDARGNVQAFVVTETDGVWGAAQEVPGTAAVNKGGRAFTESVSCPSAGDCLAVGFYEDSGSGTHPFISSQKNGTWGPITPVPGLASLPGGGLTTPDLQWAWCASAGNCVALGSYVAKDGQHNFDLTEKNGTWSDAKKIRLGARSIIAITSMACVSIGNCSAGGWYAGGGSREVFVITEKNGTWGPSEQIPGSVALNRGGFADLYSVSCGAAGDCTAGGAYSPTSTLENPFLVTQTNGTWGKAAKIPGL